MIVYKIELVEVKKNENSTLLSGVCYLELSSRSLDSKKETRQMQNEASTSLPTTTENLELCEKSPVLRRLGAAAMWLEVLVYLALLNVIR